MHELKCICCYFELKIGEYLVEVSKNEREKKNNKSSIHSKI